MGRNGKGHLQVSDCSDDRFEEDFYFSVVDGDADEDVAVALSY